MKEQRRITMPPLRPYELPDSPATVLAVPPEKIEFAIPGERVSRDEIRSTPAPVLLPPLRPFEVPESSVRILAADPDRLLDEPEWGTAKKTPDITLGRGKMLRPWDD
jgi:hypothetical protein